MTPPISSPKHALAQTQEQINEHRVAFGYLTSLGLGLLACGVCQAVIAAAWFIDRLSVRGPMSAQGFNDCVIAVIFLFIGSGLVWLARRMIDAGDTQWMMMQDERQKLRQLKAKQQSQQGGLSISAHMLCGGHLTESFQLLGSLHLADEPHEY